MDSKEILINGYEDILGALESTLSGITDEDLSWQPHPDCNSIGWLAQFDCERISLVLSAWGYSLGRP